MASINLWGASYSNVPAVDLPSTGGGTTRFYEVDGTQTVTQNGAYDVTTLANLVVDVAGGGSGLEFETGVYTPDEDIARPTIPFSQSHSKTPAIVVMIDSTGTSHSTTYSNYSWGFVDYYRITGHGIPYSSSGFRYAVAFHNYRGSSTSSTTTTTTTISYNSDNTGSSGTSYSRYWVTSSEFHPYTSSTSRYWRSGRTYTWYAIWI